jgi:hypothetical protein
MARIATAWGCILLCLAPATAPAAEKVRFALPNPPSPTAPPERLVLPGTAYVVVVGKPVRTGPEAFDQDFVDAVILWVSRQTGIVAAPPPVIRFAPAEGMVALRLDPATPSAVRMVRIGSAVPADATSVVSVYEDATGTVVLPAAWTGATPAEQSVLVHEMVHHLQNAAALIHACPEEREKPAYAAQKAWLTLFGRDLFAEFDVDAMTLLVRTTCAN